MPSYWSLLPGDPAPWFRTTTRAARSGSRVRPAAVQASGRGAVVFSCSLLHAVSRMTRGHRYAFLPFLYDEEASRLRETNNAFLGEDVDVYEQG